MRDAAGRTLRIKDLLNGVSVEVATLKICVNGDQHGALGKTLWISGKTTRNPGQTMNNWRIRRQIKRLCCHGDQGRRVVLCVCAF